MGFAHHLRSLYGRHVTPGQTARAAEIGAAIDQLVFAAYADLEAPADSSFPNLGGSWQKLDILTDTVITPEKITVDPPNSRWVFDHAGVYFMQASGSMEHNSSNQGRTFQMILYNETEGVYVPPGIVFGTARNAEATTITTSSLHEITPAEVGDWLSIHIGNGSTYTSVSFQVLTIDIFAVGEWRGWRK